MTDDERQTAILTVCRKHPQGITRQNIAKATGIGMERCYDTLGRMNRLGLVGKARSVTREVFWTAEEHLADLRAMVNSSNRPSRREWPVSTWTPPGPRIPSVWHLGQL